MPLEAFLLVKMIEPNFKVTETESKTDYAEFVIEPLEPGYGHTIGNAMRRVLLNSIEGAAVTSVKISGAKHRFSTLPGLKENLIDLLLNIKGVHFRLLDNKSSATVRLSLKGPKEITAGDLELPDGVEVINKDHYIGAFSDKRGKFDLELTIEKGYGYSLAEERRAGTIGVIPTDAIFTPVHRVEYTVEATRVGRQTNLDKLVLHVWTNGSATPKEAVNSAAKILASFFTQVFEPKAASVGVSDTITTNPSVSDDLLKLTIDELDLPTRIYNSLRNGGIETIGQLISTPKRDLMTMRNMGGKSISIIEEKLREKGTSLSV